MAASCFMLLRFGECSYGFFVDDVSADMLTARKQQPWLMSVAVKPYRGWEGGAV